MVCDTPGPSDSRDRKRVGRGSSRGCGPTRGYRRTRVSQATSSVDTEVLSGLRVLQTELTEPGILEPLLRADDTTDVLVPAPDAVWGGRRKRFAPHLDSVRRQSGCTQVGGWRRCSRAHRLGRV